MIKRDKASLPEGEEVRGSEDTVIINVRDGADENSTHRVLELQAEPASSSAPQFYLDASLTVSTYVRRASLSSLCEVYFLCPP